MSRLYLVMLSICCALMLSLASRVSLPGKPEANPVQDPTIQSLPLQP